MWRRHMLLSCVMLELCGVYDKDSKLWKKRKEQSMHGLDIGQGHLNPYYYFYMTLLLLKAAE